MKRTRTNYHACTDVTKLWFLAVVVLELVRSVVDWFDWFDRRRLVLLLLLYLLVIDKIHLETVRKEVQRQVRIKHNENTFYS